MMYDALIIGTGQIASRFDFLSDDDILTHAHAYKKHKNFNLLGFYNSDKEKAKLAAKKWSCNYYESLSEIKNVDVISVCTPDKIHVESVKEAISLHPKLIFLEKPITNIKSEAAFLLDVSKRIPIAVNYSRRYVKDFHNLAKRIQSGEFGEFITGTSYYGKGLIHNGSHIIDLLRFLIDEINFIEKKSKIADFFSDDPSWDATIFFNNNKKFLLLAVDCTNFTIFELDLLFKKGRVKILESGSKIEIYKVVNSEQFLGYKIFQKKEDIFTKMGMAMLEALNNIDDFLQGKRKLLCDIYDGYEAIKYV